MTSSQEPPGPRKSRRLAPEELARDFAKRLKSAGGADGGEKRFLPHFDMLNAGRLVMGLGALLVLAGLIVGFTWLSGLAGYETPGLVSETSPVYGCPGEPELGKVFEGEAITVIGRSADQVWLVIRDNRGPGNAVYVLHSVVAVEDDESLLSTRECQPSDDQPVAAGQTTLVEASTTTVALVSTTTPGETITTEATGTPTARPRRRTPPSPGTTTTTTTTTTRPGATTTTRPTTTTTRASTTTSSNPTSTSSSTTSTSSTTTSSTTTSSTTSTSSTTTSSTTTSSTTTTMIEETPTTEAP